MHRISLVLLGVLAVSGPSLALTSTHGDDAGLEPHVDVVSASDRGVTVVLDLPELLSERVTLAGEAFDVVSIPSGGISGQVGEPAVPTYSRLVAVPAGMSVRARTEVLETERRTGIRLSPVQAGEGTAFAWKREAYAVEGHVSPGVDVGEPAILRDLRVVPVTFRPVSYDPARGELTIARRLRVELEFEPGGAPGSAPTPQPSVPPSFAAIYEDVVLNAESALGGQIVQPGTYLVICPNAVEVTSQLQDLLQWRKRKGAPTILATTAETGTTANQIRSYIQGVYDDPSVSLEYVVLVGDASGTYSIPTWFESSSGYGGEGDLPYSQLAGGDVLPDVHLGRLSIDSATTLGYIVDKVVGYESAPYVAETDWFLRSCITGDPTSSGMSCVEAGRWVSLRLADIGFAEADTIFAGPWVSQMQTALNRGDAIFGYRGWLGMSSWSNAYTSLLTNGWKMPFAVIITCDTGSFASGTARSEAFLRAWDSSLGRPRAAIGAIGMATIGTHTRYNNCLYYGIFRGLLQEGAHTMGAALTRGCVELYLNYNSHEPNTVAIWSHWANLMGDPGVDVWTSFPEPLIVSHPANLPLGAGSVAISVGTTQDPVAGAQICLWKGDETYVVGTTGSDGTVVLPLANETTGDLLFTVTAHDRQPYLATIPVTSPTMYVGPESTLIDDDGSGDSSGNGDGLANPGETIELPVQLRNFGSQTATNVSARLTSADPCVRILDGEELFGTIAPGATAWSQEDFDVHFEGICAHGHAAPLDLEVTAGLDQWVSRIWIDIVSAELTTASTMVYDTNGRLDPGETVELSVSLRNDGGAEATAVTATLVSHSSLVTVDDPNGTFGTIGVGGLANNSADRFTVSAYPDVYEGYLATFSLVTTFSGGAVDTAHVSLVVGNRTTDDPVGPDTYGYLAFDDTDTAYAEAPTYAWVELDPAYGGDGIEIPLGDTGGYADKSTVVVLPFPFNYYGETFTEATVCSNGWLAFGATPLVSYRNWTIPGAGGPNAMLAAFWDNLYQGTGSKVLRKYDATNHVWIVEWSRMRNDYNNATETFEIILHDPAFHPTDTGDGIIVYQYETVSLTDPVNGYATVGIESPDQLDGLLYTYFNDYPAGAATLVAGRAIRFVPVSEGPIGILAGYVTNASWSDAPVEGAEVEVLQADRIFRSQADGRYAGTVPPGTYTVAVSHPSFEPDTVTAVGLQEGQTTTVDFHLVDIAPPLIATVPHPWTGDTVGPYPIPVTIEEYSGLPDKELRVSIDGGAFTPLALAPQGGNDYLAQIPGQPFGTAIRYYVYARDGLGMEATDPPGAPASTYSFAVAPSQVVLDDEFEAAGGWTVGAPDDDATTGIWARVDPVGTEYSGIQVQPEDDHTPNPGVLCYVTGNGNVGGAAGDDDVDNGKTTLFSPVFDLSTAYSASVSYWVWYSNDAGSSPGEDVWRVEVTANGGADWASLENTTQSTGQAWVQRSFVLEDHIPLTAQVQFRFVASDEGGGSLVEAAVDDFTLNAILDVFTGAESGGITMRGNALDPCTPNPFRFATRATYRVATAGPVSLRIYDVSGRLVATLVEGRSEPGEHRVEWDGRSGTGRQAASGVYFVRLATPDFSQVRRVTLLR